MWRIRQRFGHKFNDVTEANKNYSVIKKFWEMGLLLGKESQIKTPECSVKRSWMKCMLGLYCILRNLVDTLQKRLEFESSLLYFREETVVYECEHFTEVQLHTVSASAGFWWVLFLICWLVIMFTILRTWMHVVREDTSSLCPSNPTSQWIFRRLLDSLFVLKKMWHSNSWTTDLCDCSSATHGQ
jgi:hypothetical protein